QGSRPAHPRPVLPVAQAGRGSFDPGSDPLDRGKGRDGLPGNDGRRRRLSRHVPCAGPAGGGGGRRDPREVPHRRDRVQVSREGDEVSAAAEVSVRVNGEELRLPRGASVSQLLERLRVSTPRVAVERNREILPKASYPSTLLEEGDTFEVVEFVGGG